MREREREREIKNDKQQLKVGISEGDRQNDMRRATEKGRKNDKE